MKKSNVIIAICLILVCVIGWFAVGSQVIKKNSNYSNYVKEADEWVKEDYTKEQSVTISLL